MFLTRLRNVALASAFCLATLPFGASAAEHLAIVDEAGAPVEGALVELRDAAGTHELGRTDVAGQIVLPDGATGEIVVRARGFEPGTFPAGERGPKLALTRTLPTIGNVSVATGTEESLHRLPVAASSLDRRALALIPASTGDGVLRSLPGIDRTRSNSAFTAYGQLRLSFSGAGTDRGSMFVDGVPAQDGFGGQVDWAAYPAAEFQRVELLRGGGSALYGSGGIGGVLAIQTFGPAARSTPLEGSLDLGAGSHYARGAALRVRGPVGPRVAASLSSDAGTIYAFQLPPGKQTPLDTDATSTFTTTRLRAKYFGTGSSVELGFLDSYDRQAQGRPNYGFDRRLDQLDARYERAIGDGLLAISTFTRGWRVMNQADRAPSLPGEVLYTQHVPSNDTGAAVAWKRGGIDVEGDLRSIAGGSEQVDATGAPQSSAAGHQTVLGLALQDRVQGSRFEAVAGARVDSIRSRGDSTSFASPVPAVASITSRSASALSPRLAARYDLSRNLALRASASEGFRAPFLNELLRSYTISGVRYLGNPGLTPERSRTFDAGLDFIAGPTRTTLGFGETVVSNAIGFVTISPGVAQRSNLSQTQTDGVTLDVVRRLGACSRLRLSGVTQFARVTEGSPANIGKRLAFVPQQSASASYEGRLGSASAGVSLAYLGQTYADDLNADPLGTAFVAGARISAPLANGASLTLGAENLANRQYRATSDRLGPPPTVTLRWRVPFGAGSSGDGAAQDCRLP
jgi:outer membrane receptor protein involved in Fe transport